MVNGGELYSCEGCGLNIDRDAADTVAAVRLIKTPSLEGVELVEGEGVLFHARHWDARDTRYRRTS